MQPEGLSWSRVAFDRRLSHFSPDFSLHWKLWPGFNRSRYTDLFASGLKALTEFVPIVGLHIPKNNANRQPAVGRIRDEFVDSHDGQSRMISPGAI